LRRGFRVEPSKTVQSGSHEVPNTASARKRVRQNERRRALNRWRTRRIKDQVKTFLAAVQERNVETAEAEFRKTASVLDRIAAKGTIHRNKAARSKQRLARRLNELKKTARG
jgi:small subunit ribosomal protein S20